MTRGDGVLIIVQNLPVPFDRRVWLECQALRDAGYEVTVVCPKGDGRPGVRRSSTASSSTSTGRTRRAAARSASSPSTPTRSWRRPGWPCRAWRPAAFDGACRPATRRTSSGRSRWRCGAWTGPGSCSTTTTCAPSCTSPASPAARGCPTGGCGSSSGGRYRTADHVISTNELLPRHRDRRAAASPRRRRPSCAPARTRTSCSGGPAHPELRRGRRYLAAYIGVMGPQDGVDIVVRGRRHRRAPARAARTSRSP